MTADYNPTDDELRTIVDNAKIGSWVRDLARLVLRERARRLTDEERAHFLKIVAKREERAEKAEAERDELAEKLREGITAKWTDIATAREERADRAEAALARVEALHLTPYDLEPRDDERVAVYADGYAVAMVRVRAAIAGDPPAAGVSDGQR